MVGVVAVGDRESGRPAGRKRRAQLVLGGELLQRPAHVDEVVPGLERLEVETCGLEEVGADLGHDRDVEVREAGPAAVDLGQLLPERYDCTPLLGGVVDHVAHVHELLVVEIGEDLAVHLDQVVPGPRSHLGGHAHAHDERDGLGEPAEAELLHNGVAFDRPSREPFDTGFHVVRS